MAADSPLYLDEREYKNMTDRPFVEFVGGRIEFDDRGRGEISLRVGTKTHTTFATLPHAVGIWKKIKDMKPAELGTQMQTLFRKLEGMTKGTAKPIQAVMRC